jgi:hypothetical protein
MRQRKYIKENKMQIKNGGSERRRNKKKKENKEVKFQKVCH